MQFTTPLFLLFVAGVTASPLLGVSVGGISVGVAGSSGLVNVNLATAKPSSAVATSTRTTTTTAAANPTMPSSFSAPVQGQGILTLDNLPAMPAVIDKSLSGVLGAVYGLSMSTP